MRYMTMLGVFRRIWAIDFEDRVPNIALGNIISTCVTENGCCKIDLFNFFDAPLKFRDRAVDLIDRRKNLRGNFRSGRRFSGHGSKLSAENLK